jgi:hypothetical protein
MKGAKMKTRVFALIVFFLCSIANAAGYVNPPDRLSGIDLGYDAARGRYSTVTAVNLTGYNGDADASGATVLVWSGDGAYTFQTTARTLSMSGTAATDASGGTGINTLTITGLDSDYLEISEDVGMTGATAAVTTNSFFRVNSVVAKTTGTGLGSTSAITITSSTDTYRQAYLAVGDCRALQCLYTVPASKTAYITGVRASLANAAELTANALILIQSKSATSGWVTLASVPVGGAIASSQFAVPLKVLEKTSIRAAVSNGNASVSNGGGDNLKITADLDIVVVDD